MATIPSLVDMLQAGVHFGHKRSRWHPNMKPFVFGLRNNIYIINLEETVRLMGRAGDYVRDLGRHGKTLMWVGTKKQAAGLMKEAAIRAGSPYVTERWLGGTLTNFDQIYSNLLKKYLDLKGQQERGELGKYTKKEQLGFSQHLIKTEKKAGGIAHIKKAPDAIFMIDPRRETTALREAQQMNVPIVALCDTDTNPKEITFPIPCNDDGVKSIALMVNYIADCYAEGRAEYEKERADAAVAATPVEQK